jgi:NTP pyrophosphatase (non-canonical NTP hydrolase)
MTLEEIIELNYQATIRRGQVTERTRLVDMVEKLEEEVAELRAYMEEHKGLDRKELADVMLVGHTIARHLHFDLVKEMEEKAIFNSQRP